MGKGTKRFLRFDILLQDITYIYRVYISLSWKVFPNIFIFFSTYIKKKINTSCGTRTKQIFFAQNIPSRVIGCKSRGPVVKQLDFFIIALFFHHRENLAFYIVRDFRRSVVVVVIPCSTTSGISADTSAVLLQFFLILQYIVRNAERNHEIYKKKHNTLVTKRDFCQKIAAMRQIVFAKYSNNDYQFIYCQCLLFQGNMTNIQHDNCIITERQ